MENICGGHISIHITGWLVSTNVLHGDALPIAFDDQRTVVCDGYAKELYMNGDGKVTVMRKYRIEKLAFPVDGYLYNVQMLTCVDGGQNYYYCGIGKYCKTEQEAKEYIMSEQTWHLGDTCFMFTNKAKGYIAEYTVEGFDGQYYGIRRGAYYHRVSPERIFHSREEALASISTPVDGIHLPDGNGEEDSGITM